METRSQRESAPGHAVRKAIKTLRHPAQVGWGNDVSPWWCRWRVTSPRPKRCPLSRVIGHNQDSSAEALCDISAPRHFVGKKFVGVAEKHNLFLKAKLRHPLGVPQATHFSLQHKENTKWPAGFSPSPQRQSLSLALFSKLASTSSEKSPCCSSADCRRITKDKFIFSLLRLIRKEQKFLHSNEVVTAESETCRVQAPPPNVRMWWSPKQS